APLRGPFYRPLRVREVPEKVGLDRRIEATADECGAIAADYELPGVASLSAALHIAAQGDRFDVTGIVESKLTQICVVTLEPFESVLRQDVEASFTLPPAVVRGGAAERLRAAAVIDIDMEAQDDAPDLIIDNTIDLGAVALEFLMLARDPYPKKPGVHFTDVLIGEKEQEDPSPFAALERFKDQS
ncbi:DUF177 domain-containing protein, partial [Beijerinckia sp. L45]|uniref:YceD family protein n=1 Tax=Beijerinckia sp. L45 TaxID=1641855 RepID=UPI00131E4100